MKKFINVAVLLLLSASAASAQLLEQARITVPFAFVAAGKVLPAGDYKVQVNPDHNVLVISSHDRLSAMVLVPGSERSAQPGTRIRFRLQDEKWVLNGVTISGVVHEVRSRKTKQELAFHNKPSQQRSVVEKPTAGF